MMPCCYHCYATYLNDDGSINWKEYHAIVKETVNKMLYEVKNRIECHDKIFTGAYRHVYTIDFNPNRICTCECHKRVKNVIH